MFTNVHKCSQMFTNVYKCSQMRDSTKFAKYIILSPFAKIVSCICCKIYKKTYLLVNYVKCYLKLDLVAKVLENLEILQGDLQIKFLE